MTLIIIPPHLAMAKERIFTCQIQADCTYTLPKRQQPCVQNNFVSLDYDGRTRGLQMNTSTHFCRELSKLNMVFQVPPWSHLTVYLSFTMRQAPTMNRPIQASLAYISLSDLMLRIAIHALQPAHTCLANSPSRHRPHPTSRRCMTNKNRPNTLTARFTGAGKWSSNKVLLVAAIHQPIGSHPAFLQESSN